MRDAVWTRRAFWVLWVSVLLVKVAVATRLPLFVDEAFYWQEGRHPAAAYGQTRQGRPLEVGWTVARRSRGFPPDHRRGELDQALLRDS